MRAHEDAGVDLYGSSSDNSKAPAPVILAIWLVTAMAQGSSPSPSIQGLTLASAKVVATYAIPLHPFDGSGAPPSRDVEFGGFSIAVAPNGDVWYTAPGGVGRLTPTGTPTWYSLAKAAGPGDIHLGPDGAMWFVEAGVDKVGRITSDGSISEFTGSPLLGDLNALGFDAPGNVWVSGTNSQYVAKMGRKGELTIIDLPYDGDTAPQLPWGSQSIVLGGDGSMWISEYQSPIVHIAKNGSISRVAVSGPVLSLVVGPDGDPRYIHGFNLDPSMALVTLHPDGSTLSAPISPRYETSEPLSHEILGSDKALWCGGYHWYYRVALDGSLTRYWIPGDNPAPASFAQRGDGPIWAIGQTGSSVVIWKLELTTK